VPFGPRFLIVTQPVPENQIMRRFRIKSLPWTLLAVGSRYPKTPAAISPPRFYSKYSAYSPVDLEDARKRSHVDFDPNCFQGSTNFYVSAETDEFTPSLLEAGLLKDNVATRWDSGKLPPWIEGGDHRKSPSEQYVEWFNGIWHTGDPTTWNEHVFTERAVMIDPSGISTGAKQAAANFLLLFKFFPGLRGEVVSWAANDREILINWRFQLLRKGNKTPLLVPVIDKFCFVKGKVSFRLAYFDIITFIGYLSQTYGLDQLTDFLIASFRQSEKTGGIQRLPTMLWNLVSGLFFWPPITPTNVVAIPGDGQVRLEWAPVEGAEFYVVSRATSLGGDYEMLPPSAEFEVGVPRYVDRSVSNGTTYWYLVTPRYKKWRPTPVRVDEPIAVSPARTRRLRNQGYEWRDQTTEFSKYQSRKTQQEIHHDR
jgi:hypothetical protein